jgi:phosphoglycerate dehydrogenase-like enzyme
MKNRPHLLLALDRAHYERMFSPRDRDRLHQATRLIHEEPPVKTTKDWLLQAVEDAEVVVTSWDSPCLDEEVMAKAPKLGLVAHAGGSVKPFVSEGVWRSGARVTSAAAAIGHGVAEFCLGLLLTGCKRAAWLARETREGGWQEGRRDFGGWFELYQQTVGVIGAGHVGRRLIGLLRELGCDILVFDPYLGSDEAASLGVRKASTLEEVFSESRAVSVNAPTTPSTIGMIRGRHFALLRPGSLFINTARAALVDEEEMVRELRRERFVACLDVTDPEPPPADHPLRRLPNVMLTPHIAGAVAENQLRIGSFVAEEIERYVTGRPAVYPVRREDLERVA